jgi:hypothetical protein
MDAGVVWNNTRASLPATGGIMFVPAGSYALTTAFTFGGQSNVTVLISAGVTLTGTALPAATGTNAFIDLRGGLTLTGPTTLGTLTTTGVVGLNAAIDGAFGAVIGGALGFSADNIYDVGAIGARRPRTGYFGTSLVVQSNAAVNPGATIRLPNNNVAQLMVRNAANTFDINLIGLDAANVIRIGNSMGSGTNPASMVIGLGGALTFETDNIVDIGASGANRPRTGYLGTSLVIGSDPGGTGAFRLQGGITMNTSAQQSIGTLGFLSGVNLSIGDANPAAVRLLLRGAPSQTGDFIQLQNTGTTNIFEFTTLASMVNGIQFNPANTGGQPNLVGIGTDAVIGIDVIGKGASQIRFGTNSNVQGLQVSSPVSAVNAVFVQGAITAAVPSVVASGSDASIPLDVAGKSVTGTLRLNQLTGADIEWGRPLVALGGGAAPTFGTIGGSGPATAAQNTWMRVVDSTGAAFFVPAWK